jgi:prophage maintenance system killer protein
MVTFLGHNGWELAAGVAEQEQVILRLAAGTVKRDEFTAWVQAHLQQRPDEQGAATDRPRE